MYDKEILVIAGIRRSIEKFKHYKAFSGRIRSFIEAELPGYTISLHKEEMWCHGISEYEIGVWGKDIPYQEGIRINWNDNDSTREEALERGGGWIGALLYALDLRDPTDSAERIEQEKTLVPLLTEYDKRARELLSQLKDLQADAQVQIAALPVPMSAKVRRREWMWKGPSQSLASQFPLLFKSEIDLEKE